MVVPGAMEGDWGICAAGPRALRPPLGGRAGTSRRLALVSKGESETLLVDPGETARRLKALLYTSNLSVSVILRLPGRAVLLAVAQPSAEEGDS